MYGGKKDDGYVGRRMLRMELAGKRKRGELNRRFMDVLRDDTAVVEVTEKDAEDWTKFRCKSAEVTLWEKPKEEECLHQYHYHPKPAS